MKRRHILAATIPAAALAVAGSLWWTATALPIAAISSQLEAQTGLRMSNDGAALVALLPRPRVKIPNVTLHDGDGRELARAGHVQASFKLASLLRGRLTIDDVRLAEAIINVDVDRSGAAPWATVAGRLLQAGQGDNARGETIADVTLVDSEVRYRNAANGTTETLTILDGTIDLPSDVAGTTWDATTIWRGEPVAISGRWPSPAMLGKSGGAGTVTVSGTHLNLSLTGTVTATTEQKLDGRLTLSTPSMEKLATWAGLDGPFIARLPAVTLSGAVALTPRSVAMPVASLTLGRDKLEGALAMRLDSERPAISGTLASQTLKLDPLLPPPSVLQEDARWASRHFDWSAMGKADLDLRVSASEATIGTLELNQVAFGLILRNGRLETNVVRADIDSGSVKGRIAMAPAPAGGLDIRGQVAVDKVEAATLLAPLFPTRPVSGATQGTLSFEAVGGSMADLVASADGRGQLAIAQGTLAGINLGEVIRAADRSPPPVTFDWRGGRTTFERLTVPFTIRRGQVDIALGQVQAPGVSASVAGAIRMPNQSLSLRAGIVNAAQPARGPIMFDIAGDLGNVQVTPDMRGIIERISPPRVAPINFRSR